MKIGQKFKKGYDLLAEKRWEGIFFLFEAVTNLYMLDAIDETIYNSLVNYVRNVDMIGENTEENQWMKVLMLDSRYAGLLLKPGNLLENLTNVLDAFPEVPDDEIIDVFMEGGIPEAKYAEGAIYFIQKDFVKKQSFLVRKCVTAGEMITQPIDFDVEAFSINRTKKRIEYSYTRGKKTKISVDYNGENKVED